MLLLADSSRDQQLWPGMATGSCRGCKQIYSSGKETQKGSGQGSKKNLVGRGTWSLKVTLVAKNV